MLIDANKLKAHFAWWHDDKQKLFNDIIDQQKAVDAIPVEWIIKWSAQHLTEYGTFTIERLIEDWRKEHVVQEETETGSEV